MEGEEENLGEGNPSMDNGRWDGAHQSTGWLGVCKDFIGSKCAKG